MALPLLPLIGLAAQLVPGIVGAVAGDKAGKVAGDIANVATAIFGTDQAGVIETAIARDPEKALQFRLELERIKDREEERRHLERMEQMRSAASAITTEGASADPWTSRARPTFLYVMYLMILSALPMGVLYAFAPAVADDIATGIGRYLKALPEEMWALFGAGYLGYAGFRSWDKTRRQSASPK